MQATETTCYHKKEMIQEHYDYRKILGTSYKDHVTNEEVRAKIQQAIGPRRRPPDHSKETQTAVL